MEPLTPLINVEIKAIAFGFPFRIGYSDNSIKIVELTIL